MTKKNIKYYLFVIIWLLSSCSNDLTNKEVEGESECLNCNDIFLDPMYNHFYTEDRTLPFTGKCKGYTKSGAVIVEKNYIDGKLDGPYLEYFEDGAIKSQWSFLKGRQHGEFKGYFPDGSMEYHTIYYKGDLDSTIYP